MYSNETGFLGTDNDFALIGAVFTNIFYSECVMSDIRGK